MSTVPGGAAEGRDGASAEAFDEDEGAEDDAVADAVA